MEEIKQTELKNEETKILIIDDDPINIRNASRILKEEYKIIYATSGKTALELMVKENPDLVLLDIHMPEMNGFEVMQRMKEQEDLSDIPVILLTADTEGGTEAQGLRAGALDYIAKPFVDEVVRQRVRRLVELYHLRNSLQCEVEKQTRKAEERRKQVEELSFQTVRALADAIDAKDRYTNGHSSRVAKYSVLLAKELSFDKETIDSLHYAALLHDVGKIGVPDAVLNKPGRLTDIEFDVIKSHTTIGEEILRNITTVANAREVAAHHHERYDGKGYPSKLKGNEIPYMARIVCIADSFDAMNSKRCYRNSLSPEVIREELVKGRGTQFDPDYLDVFLRLFDANALDSSEQEEAAKPEGSAALLKVVLQSAYDNGVNDQTDALTGLCLRKVGEARIREEMVTGPGFLAILDLDNLKKLNDLFGHKSGDALIERIGKILSETEGLSVACRLGGDEFLIYGSAREKEAVSEVLDRVYKRFEEEKDANSNYRYNSLSGGVVLTRPTDVFEDAYNHADKALYLSKQSGKNRYHYYEVGGEYDGRKDNADLESLVQSFMKAGEYEGAMSVDYREFAQLFEYVRNMKRRYAHDMQLLMITLNTEDVGSMHIEKMEEAVRAMENSIRSAIRTVDICTRYSQLQFLVILVGTGKDEIPSITERVFSGFYKSFPDWNIRLSYDIASLDEAE